MRIKATELAQAAEVEPLYKGPNMETEPETMPQISNQRKTSDIVLVILGVFLLAFIVTMIVIFCVKGSVPDTLIQCTMGTGSIEAFALAWIKVRKIKASDRSKSDTDGSDGAG